MSFTPYVLTLLFTWSFPKVLLTVTILKVLEGAGWILVPHVAGQVLRLFERDQHARLQLAHAMIAVMQLHWLLCVNCDNIGA